MAKALPATSHSAPEADRATRHSRIGKAFVDFTAGSRRTISTHRQTRRKQDREISDHSRRGLDWTNFFIADVQVGFGAFLAFYLANLEWSKQSVGLALTVGGLAGVLAQIPGGALADAVRWKRGLLACGIGMIAASALILALWPSVPLVIAAVVLHGISGGLITPTIAAISLGIAGRQRMSLRVGRNFRFAAAGNALTAAAMGGLGYYLSSNVIFLVAAILCIPTLLALAQIRPEEIDYARARNASKRDHTIDLQRIVELARNRKLLVFAICVVLFHFSNASLLPLVAQNLGHSADAMSPLFMAGMIIVPQIIVALLAPWIGYWSELWGRRPLLLAGFAVLVVRALLFTIISEPLPMIAVQMLDGITGAVMTVLTILVLTDLTSGTGRFNLAQGVIGTLMAIATALSTGVFGFVVEHAGDLPGILTMTAVAAAGMGVLWLFLGETKPEKYQD
jgi:MFS family permease